MALVVKRDGNLVVFNREKIRLAILKAMKYGSGIVSEATAKLISLEAENKYNTEQKGNYNPTVTIKEIEKFVFDRLVHHGHEQTARAYEGYRAVQEYKRANKDNPIVKHAMELIGQSNEELMLENANKDATLPSTQRDLIAGEVSKMVSNTHLIPAHLVQADNMGIIKIHDKDYLMNDLYNCELVNIDDMLQNGTVINKKMIRKPRSLRTAMTVVTQICASVASSTYGGQTISLSHIAPFVRVEKERIKRELIEDIGEFDNIDEVVMKRLKREIKHSVQLFNYQINTISTTQGQSPFVSLAMYISENPEYEEETAMLIEEFLRQRIEGMENEHGIVVTQTFPKLLFFMDENNAYEGSKYFYLTKLSAMSTAKRLSPDIISVKVMKDIYGIAYPPMGQLKVA